MLTFLHSLQPGGVERDVLRFAKAWRAAGIDARIVIGRWEGALINEAPDIPYFVLPAGKIPKAHFGDLRMILRLPGIIRRFRPDVLLLASNNHALIGLAMRMLLAGRCPPIILRVSMDLARPDLTPLFDRLDKWAFRCYAAAFTQFVAMAAPVRPQIAAYLAIPQSRVVTIMNGSMTVAELGHFATARDAVARGRIGRKYLAIGRLAPQKNFMLLLESFARIARADDLLTIVGEGEERAKLESRSRQLGIAAQVRMPGYSFEIASWLAGADAFILSSDFEGLGNVVVEALAAGLPIVATDCCAAMPMLVEGAGMLVPIRDGEALAAAMDTICDRDIDVAMLRARAAGFTVEAATEHWKALFEQVAPEAAH